MSNPIHSTSAKSVLPMLAMRGLATGLCAGCVVGLLRLSHDRAAARVALWLEEWREVWWTVPIWFGVLVALAVILRRIVREEPLISGSGIPQTELALAGRLSFTWWRVLLAKFLGSWLALFGGLALGREGPSIQMGGAVGAGFHALWRPAPPHALTGSPYVVAGAVAGLAAAFGAPAAGVLFAFEEMKSRRDTSLIVAVDRRQRQMCIRDSNKTLLWLHDREAGQTLIPDRWRALPPLLLAGCLALFAPLLIGGGESLIIFVGEHDVALKTLILLLAFKYLFAQYSTVASIPGGLLMPILCLGALWGRLWAELPVSALAAHGLASGSVQPYVLFGMVSYFAATVRAPLTGIVLVTEMSGTYTCLPGSLLAGLIACKVANLLHCPPVYDSLKERIRL